MYPSRCRDMADTRAKAIARTETSLAGNAGRLEGYAQTGMKGEVEWVSHIDERTSEACRHLDGARKPLGEKFNYKDWEGYCPPQHVNCRSRLVFHPE